MTTLDTLDWRLLDALQRDASLTNAALAEQIGLSASQVSRRRQRLEQEGVIRGYRATLEPAAVGLGVIVFIHVALGRIRATMPGAFAISCGSRRRSSRPTR